jgi:hypothetical protein
MANEPQPNLKLTPQEIPPQKINITHMPLRLYNELLIRANKLGKKVSIYCRIVLEHAVDHREHYNGVYESEMPIDSFSSAIHVPVKNKEFMQTLLEWDPYGHRKRTDIALSILRKHLEVRKW